MPIKGATSKHVAHLLADLGITKSQQRLSAGAATSVSHHAHRDQMTPYIRFVISVSIIVLACDSPASTRCDDSNDVDCTPLSFQDTSSSADQLEATVEIDTDETQSPPRISVLLEGAPISNGDAITLPTGLQIAISKSLSIWNPGDSKLHIYSVDWDVDTASGRIIKNPFLDLNLGGSSIPTLIEPGESITFSVRLISPAPFPPDYTRSVILIKSDAFDADSGAPESEFRVEFGFSVDAIPRVTPTSYIFRNASPSRAERQPFRVYSDSLATAPFRILSARLEIPSTEFTVDAGGAEGMTILPPFDPSYRDAVLSVAYQPSDVGADSNAVIIQTDVGQTLRVELSADP